MDIDRLLRARDICAIAGISRSYLYQLIQEKRFPAPIKVGSASRWRASDLRSFIDAVAKSSRT